MDVYGQRTCSMCGGTYTALLRWHGGVRVAVDPTCDACKGQEALF